jgi:hypothetical protein
MDLIGRFIATVDSISIVLAAPASQAALRKSSVCTSANREGFMAAADGGAFRDRFSPHFSIPIRQSQKNSSVNHAGI